MQVVVWQGSLASPKLYLTPVSYPRTISHVNMPAPFDLPDDLPTPALIVDAATVDRNLSRMADYCARHELRLRPHTKTHKSRLMAQRQLAQGAQGLTVAKAGEAEVMASIGTDILIAYPTVGPARLQKVVQLARKVKVTVAIDSLEAAEQIAAAAAAASVSIHVLVDVDVGFHRTGVPDPHAATTLATICQNLPTLRLQGILCFPGHLQASDSEQAWQDYTDQVGKTVESFRERGLPIDVVSGGSTPTAAASHRNPWLTEIRPGTYIYNDRNELSRGHITLDDCAARVIATVVSHSGLNKVVIDAGSKMLSSDRCGPAPDSGFGYLIDLPNSKLARLTEEHGEIELAPQDPRPDIGSKISILPNHICPCVNLQDYFYLWEHQQFHRLPVDARGQVV